LKVTTDDFMYVTGHSGPVQTELYSQLHHHQNIKFRVYIFGLSITLWGRMGKWNKLPHILNLGAR